jgi:hypothetical protein
MPEVAYSLWPPDIKPTTQSPFAILDLQARALTQQTEGVLAGDLRVAKDDQGRTTLYLDMVVPALGGYRQEVLTATHKTEQVYPVRVDAACFRWIAVLATVPGLSGKKPENEAASDEEFRRVVEKVLHSDEVKSVAQSLIARSNETLNQRKDEAERNGA